MAYLNKLCIIGRIGKINAPRETANGGKVVRFSVACSKYTKASAGMQEQTKWWNCEVWNKPAEVLFDKAKVGDIVYVEGEPWDDKGQDGKVYTTVKFCSFQFISFKLGVPEENVHADNPVRHNNPLYTQAPPAQEAAPMFDMPDDLGF